MARKSKTAAQRRQESYEADRRAWGDFMPRLLAIQSWTDACTLCDQTVPPDTPGRRYYSNLGFFLGNFAAPAGANATELTQYIRLIQLFDAEGLLPEGVRVKVEKDLRNALERVSIW